MLTIPRWVVEKWRRESECTENDEAKTSDEYNLTHCCTRINPHELSINWIEISFNMMPYPVCNSKLLAVISFGAILRGIERENFGEQRTNSNWINTISYKRVSPFVLFHSYSQVPFSSISMASVSSPLPSAINREINHEIRWKFPSSYKCWTLMQSSYSSSTAFHQLIQSKFN